MPFLIDETLIAAQYGAAHEHKGPQDFADKGGDDDDDDEGGEDEAGDARGTPDHHQQMMQRSATCQAWHTTRLAAHAERRDASILARSFAAPSWNITSLVSYLTTSNAKSTAASTASSGTSSSHQL